MSPSLFENISELIGSENLISLISYFLAFQILMNPERHPVT
jgi:hypothetical protein